MPCSSLCPRCITHKSGYGLFAQSGGSGFSKSCYKVIAKLLLIYRS